MKNHTWKLIWKSVSVNVCLSLGSREVILLLSRQVVQRLYQQINLIRPMRAIPNIDERQTVMCCCESVDAASSPNPLRASVKDRRLVAATSVSPHTTSSLRAVWMNSY